MSIKQGERVARSPTTGCFYLVTRWQEYDDGSIRAIEKHEISDREVVERLGDDVPEEWGAQIEDNLWREVDA